MEIGGNKIARFHVKFNQTSGYPEKWEKRLQDNTLVLLYEVKKWEAIDSSKPTLYPKKATLTYFTSNKVDYIIDLTIDEILVDKSLGEDETPDPVDVLNKNLIANYLHNNSWSFSSDRQS